MWQCSARPVITAASTHLLLRTYGHTNTAPLRSSLNKCFPHTPTSSLNTQCGPPAGLTLVPCGQLQFISRRLELGKLYVPKKMHVVVGSTGQLMNCHLRDLCPIRGIKGNRRVPEKLSRVVTTRREFNLTPSASRTRSRSECTGGTDSWEEDPRSSSPNDLREVGEHLGRDRMNLWKLQGHRRFLKGQ